MTLFCERAVWRLRSVDGGGSCVLRGVEDWDTALVRSRVPDAEITVDACKDFDSFERRCDLLELTVGGTLVHRLLFDGVTGRGDGTVTLGGVGRTELLNSRRFPTRTVFSESAGSVWSSMWQIANGQAPTGLTSGLSGGPLLDFDVAQFALVGSQESTVAPHIVWAEHGGALYDWLQTDRLGRIGRPLTPDWVVNQGCGDLVTEDSDGIVNDLVLAFTASLDQFVEFNSGGGCVLQSGPIEQPAVTSEDEAILLLQEWAAVLAQSEYQVPRVDLDPSGTRIEDLVPGVLHRDHIAGSGSFLELDTAALSGVGDCVTGISARFDGGSAGLRQLLGV